FGNVVVNLTGLEQFHQGKSHDKTDRSPLEASQSHVEHPGQMVAQPSAALKPRVLKLRSALCVPGLTATGKRTMAAVFEQPGTSECNLPLCVVRIGLTVIPRFAYDRGYDHKNFCSHRCYWICRDLHCASAVAHSGRIAVFVANISKASRGQKSRRDGLAGWRCCIGFVGCLARGFAESQTRG